VNAHSFAAFTKLADLGERFVEELEDFFVNYHDLDDEKYRVRDAQGPKAAKRCLRRAIRQGKR
jgi:inorganic pyrophosphatase